MAVFTPVASLATGDDLPVTSFDAVAQNTLFNYQTPYLSCFDNVGTTLTSGVAASVNLGGTTRNAYGYILSGGEAIVPLAGAYFCGFCAQAVSGTGSAADIFVATATINGVTFAAGSTANTQMGTVLSSGTGIITANAGDGFGLTVSQNSGSTLTTTVSNTGTYLTLIFIGST